MRRSDQGQEKEGKELDGLVDGCAVITFRMLVHDQTYSAMDDEARCKNIGLAINDNQQDDTVGTRRCVHVGG
eukprot:1194844-Prorocentrum_minimum.AAC.5